ncbi:F-box/WD repeat-containing protein 12 [Paramormyrops kingsleyae]|uniref:F-box/WD repeat-containing protein 12 n=1 Tax=Paramormyrops kingsleyae TaxID=1676925 RepID=UPI003B96C665
MDSDLSDLTLDCLIHVFSLLTDNDLINASGVCKRWYEAAETPWLWRQMCLHRWSFCNISRCSSENGKRSWKSYYLQRSSLEHKMKTGRSCTDYTCKSLRGHTGRVVGLAYLQENRHDSDNWERPSIVCSASSDGTVRAWNVQQGVQLWSSPVQSPLSGVVTDPQREAVFTWDTSGVIKAWDGCTGQEVAAFPTAASKCKLLPFSADDQSALFVGTSSGAVCMLAVPSLSLVWRQVLFQAFNIDILISSPDKKWILAASTEGADCHPQVFCSRSLRCVTEDDPPLGQSVPVSCCLAAIFLASEPPRVAVLHSDAFGYQTDKTLSVFEITIKKSKYKQEVEVQQVESFPLGLTNWHTDVHLQARGAATFVVAAGNHLRVYTLKGALLATFEDHTEPIASFCVDSFRVVTASRDLSLRVLTWKKERDAGLSLESRFHLLGGSHTRAWGFTHVICDYKSIVASVEARDEKDVLKAYSFNA